MQGPGLREVRDRSKSPEWKKRCTEELPTHSCHPHPSWNIFPSLSFLCCQSQESSGGRQLT